MMSILDAMTYKETLDWMFTQLPMYQQKGKTAFTGKMDNILAFATHLKNPEKKFKTIHVAGTNGKGSSSHMLASILQEAGYKVGLYTSPHLKDYRERIKINGKPLSKKFVVDFISRNTSFFEKNKLSFFEMTVGMAFDYFAKNKVDIAIIEVGLGGRLDSTNIIIPEVSLITNIGYDHTDILGNTLEQIAHEKGGIIKKNVPVVISENQVEIVPIFKQIAATKNAKIIFASDDDNLDYKTSLQGAYQVKNIKGVVAVIHELKGFNVSEKHINRGLEKVVSNTGFLGRWQVLGEKPKVVCDTAHNKEGLTVVLNQIAKQKYKQLHIVIGFVKGKNLDDILSLFPKNAHYYFCSPKMSRGLNAQDLMIKSKELHLDGKSYSSVKKAYHKALKNAGKNDLIYIGGSTFVVAEII